MDRQGLLWEYPRCCEREAHHFPIIVGHVHANPNCSRIAPAQPAPVPPQKVHGASPGYTNPLLNARPLLPGDLAGCVALANADGARGPLLDAALLGELLDRYLLIGRVIERRQRDLVRICGYGLSALVEPTIVAAARRSPQPDLVARLLIDAAAGKPCLLNRRDGAHLGRRGTREMLVINFAVEAGVDSEAAIAMLHTAFMEANSGYGLAGLTAEIRPWEKKSEYYKASLRAMGCAESSVDARTGTQLFWLEAGFVQARPFHLLQQLFTNRAPILKLSPALRDVLELACLGYDDIAIATALGIAVDTVRKRWRSIYERVAARAPMILAAGSRRRAPANARRTRGPEKRRAVVEFVRLHLHELRP